MQQTEHYKLNLIETGDPLSPAPLNENAQKTETALDAQDARIIRLENCRIITGSYWGTGQRDGQYIDLGEQPLAVLISTATVEYGFTAAVCGDTEETSNFVIENTGFRVAGVANYNRRYSFFAFMGNWAEIHIHEPFIGL